MPSPRSAHKPSFPRAIARPTKRAVGRSPAEKTPLNVRTSGVDLAEDDVVYVRARLRRRLGRYAPHIERLTARFDDVNGPRGGVDTVCKIKIVLSGLDSVVYSAHAADARTAADVAAAGVATALGRALGRSAKARRPAVGAAKAAPRAPSSEAMRAASRPTTATGRVRKRHPGAMPADGALIGRRVGRANTNLARVLERPEKVDTALPGRSATDRRAGGRSTARRNVRAAAPRAAATLEDSARDRPSRKSSRKSANRGRQDKNLRLRSVGATHAPGARARASKATTTRRKKATRPPKKTR